MQNKTTMATLAALSAQVIFGFSFMFTKIALDYASPMTVIADRYLVAFISLSLVMLFWKIKPGFTKNMSKLLLMAFFQPVIYFLCESYGIKLSTSGFSSVMISLIPVVSIFGGMLFLKEIPTPVQILFTLLSVLGVGVMAYSGNMDGTVTVGGIILLFGAVLSSVAYNVMSRKISKEFTAFERTYAMMFTGLLVFLLIALIENRTAPLNLVIHFVNPLYTASILYFGVASSVIAFVLLNFANTYLPVSKTTVFSNITTVVSVVAGVVFLGEPFGAVTVCSALMIVVGVWGAQRTGQKTIQ